MNKLLPPLFPIALIFLGCGSDKQDLPIENRPQINGATEERTVKINGTLYLNGSDTPYTGKVFSSYQSGQRKSEESYANGKSDGLKTFWYKDGNIMQKMNYKDGKLHGSNIMWLNNGKKHFEINSKNGRRDGLNIYWYKNGQKRSEENYKEGKQDGLFTSWHENGQKRSEVNYMDGNQISGKYWNSKGHSVNSYDETLK